jgi:hypothetical protein
MGFEASRPEYFWTFLKKKKKKKVHKSSKANQQKEKEIEVGLFRLQFGHWDLESRDMRIR